MTAPKGDRRSIAAITRREKLVQRVQRRIAKAKGKRSEGGPKTGLKKTKPLLRLQPVMAWPRDIGESVRRW